MLTDSQIKRIISALLEAGKAIMQVYRSDEFGIRIKPDDSPVTHADMASDRIIKSALQSITPGIPVYSEETKDVPYSVRREWSELWILDPLDGTKEFIARSDEFCISLALIMKQFPVAGFIHSPVTYETWFAEKGKGAWRLQRNKKEKLPIAAQQGPFRVNVSRTHHSHAEEEWITNFSLQNETVKEITGSAIKFCRIAEGATDLYPKFSLIHEWDIAAGQIIIEEAGGRIIEPGTGKPPLFNKEDYLQAPFVAFGQRITDWKNWL